MEDTLLLLFCTVDDFLKDFMPAWNKQLLASGLNVFRQVAALSTAHGTV